MCVILITIALLAFCWLLFKAPLLSMYRASLSGTAYSYSFSALLMVITAFFMTNEPTDWSLTESEFLEVIYARSASLGEYCQVVSVRLHQSCMEAEPFSVLSA
ncbi:hypothetical protein ACB092_12G200000 [Castanea dentata]